MLEDLLFPLMSNLEFIEIGKKWRLLNIFHVCILNSPILQLNHLKVCSVYHIEFVGYRILSEYITLKLGILLVRFGHQNCNLCLSATLHYGSKSPRRIDELSNESNMWHGSTLVKKWSLYRGQIHGRHRIILLMTRVWSIFLWTYE